MRLYGEVDEVDERGGTGLCSATADSYLVVGYAGRWHITADEASHLNC